jgi:RNA polymerase sigma-70 factor (ECF subfamily)
MKCFEEIYKEYFRVVYYYILAICNNADVAEDITQETFYKATKSLKNFRNECDIKTWLCQIAKNQYLTYCRKKKVETHLDDINEVVECDVSFEEKLADQDTADKIHKILHNLPEPYKEVFYLRIFGELPFKKIGDVFSKTENWACVTYHRAKAMVQKEMEDYK